MLRVYAEVMKPWRVGTPTEHLREFAEDHEAIRYAKSVAAQRGEAIVEGPPQNGIPVRVSVRPMPEGGYDIREAPLTPGGRVIQSPS